MADFAFSTRGNFSANFIHLLYGIAFAVLEIQSHLVVTGCTQAFEKRQGHIAPAAQTQVNRGRVNGRAARFDILLGDRLSAVLSSTYEHPPAESIVSLPEYAPVPLLPS
ncbi:hypothetical protein C1Y11_19710 [Pseudomonas sp. FW305-20]|nr:hypothetical protein C1Y11_19710 [Pseudomonas sp. FW305-20]PMU16777.1 hypothetical protein C1Y10_18285 [Pseudomonas sp. FW305-122]PMU37753.1 hypothetical protein C1Y12_18480 [Pseudomonas sp. FW305-47B]PMX58784.1 hypothetical protein C1Y13_19585 [Pseudomonas sp. FW305-33]PMX67300.1 hypothetical protein C1X12_14390 [Pseudomonas sp. FW305-60]